MIIGNVPGVAGDNVDEEDNVSALEEVSLQDIVGAVEDTADEDFIADVCPSPSSVPQHDYAKPASDHSVSEISSVISPASDSCFSPSPQPPPTPQKEPESPVFLAPLPPDISTRLLFEVRNKLFQMLPYYFTSVVDNRGIHVLMVGRRESKAVKRELFVSSGGDVRIEVHGQEYATHSVLQDVMEQKPLLNEQDIGYFVDRIVQIVTNLRLLEVCAGMDKTEFKNYTSNGVVEGDLFKECRYRETFRSKTCSLLVPTRYWRCIECSKL
ncbi:LOW QUALITY PROTEIN: Zinc metalloprotease [Frankliniella fusca]|uniref:Zinc metalloprotease n=1 Tax=Frankliniella fusca TaxID=407009 RepID=A0AAE1LAB5_9NEOP|nr:LOW QUALITY PROTEIN: Zinc metalloprotease [Frankliniella fusca]